MKYSSRAKPINRQCLNCGYLAMGSDCYCAKCDAELAEQTDESILTVDIAHSGETIAVAIAKLESAIDHGLDGYFSDIYLITGNSMIKEAAIQYLKRNTSTAMRYSIPRHNQGMVRLSLRSKKSSHHRRI